MAKTNYTKAEEMLDQNLRQMTVDHLLDEVDKNKGIDVSKKREIEIHKHLISTIKREYFALKKDPQLYEKIGVTQNELKVLLEEKNLTSADWITLEKIHKNIKQFKEELKAKNPQANDESLVESQRKKHVTKRFNTNDKWLPLQ